MFATAIIGVFASLLAAMRDKSGTIGLKLAMMLIFVFLAIRYDFGNDYMSYFYTYQEIGSHGFSTKFKGMEYGWIFLNSLFFYFGKNGFFIMLMALAALNSVVLYFFIKKYVPPQYYWFAVFAYVFNPYNMLVLSSAMRQNVAMLCFLIGIKFLIERKLWLYLLMIGIATFFHTSAYILFLLAALIFLGNAVSRKEWIAWWACFGIIIVLPTLFIRLLNYDVLESYLPFWASYMKGEYTEIKYGLGFFAQFMIFIMMFLCFSKQSERLYNIFLRLTFFYIFFYYSAAINPICSRFALYFPFVSMLVLPLAFAQIKNDSIRLAFILFNVFFIFYNYYVFFQSSLWQEKFYEYHTIFSI